MPQKLLAFLSTHRAFAVRLPCIYSRFYGQAERAISNGQLSTAWRIQNDIQVAAALQINGTPSFLVGKTVGEEVSGAIIVGAQPFSVFEAKFREAETVP